MEPFLAQVMMFGGTFPIRGWAMCDGQILAINSQQSLYSLLGTTYGGDGRTTFALPDLRSRTPMHKGNNYDLGQRTGQETVVLTTNEIPAHSHTGTQSFNAGTGKTSSNPASGGFFADTNAFASTAGTGSIAGLTIGSTGGNQGHDNIQPYCAINFLIALEGVFPSRN